ncbi:hypothetical protein BDW22DRAFT_227635 [Trametopsis cervina]|nr:hypothetical protein BDW22DRAFT_227635 [Trametopsis cervina]
MHPGVCAASLRTPDCSEFSSPPMRITTKREALLQQEQELLKALTSVRHQLNGATPIGSLPTEIIREIFRWIVATPSVPPYPYASTLSHVCRQWYQVATATPDLWSLIVLAEQRKLIDASLTRSKDAPLDVVTNHGDSNYTSVLSPSMLPVLRHILHHAHRIRTIDFSLDKGSLEVMEGLPKVHLPRLRYLSIAAFDLVHRRCSFTFESLNCPDIRELSIARCDIPFEKIVEYTKLTSLSIDLSNYRTSKAPSEMLMLDILKATPELVTLRLLDVFLPDELATTDGKAKDSAIINGHTILLPRLSSAELGGNAAAIASILRHVHFPATAGLSLPSIESESSANSEALVGPLRARLDGSVTIGSHVHFQSMYVQANSYAPVVLRCWVKTSHDRGLSPQERLPCKEDPDFELCNPTRALALGTLYPLLLLNVQSLWMAANRECWLHSTFAFVYENSKRVLELRLRNFSLDAIVKMLDVSESPEESKPQDEDVGKMFMQPADTNSGAGVGFGEYISSSSSHSRPMLHAHFNFPNLQALYVSKARFKNRRGLWV